METLLWIGIGVYLLVKWINGKTRSSRILTKEESDAMLREMIGRSEKECRQVLKKYKNR